MGDGGGCEDSSSGSLELCVCRGLCWSPVPIPGSLRPLLLATMSSVSNVLTVLLGSFRGQHTKLLF